MKTLFISGNDTDVGKTYVGRISGQCLSAARAISVYQENPSNLAVLKPLRDYIQQMPSAYFEACQKLIPLSEICPTSICPRHFT
jgi:hypothetical protein